MSGYIYKYISRDSSDVIYVGQSKNQISLINRLASHKKHDGWSHLCDVEYAEIPYVFGCSPLMLHVAKEKI